MRLFRKVVLAVTVLALSMHIVAEAAPRHPQHHYKMQPHTSSSRRTSTHKSLPPSHRHASSSKKHVSTSSKHLMSTPKNVFSSPQHMSLAQKYESPAPKRESRSRKHTSRRASSSRKHASSSRKHASFSQKHVSSSRKHVSSSRKHASSSPKHTLPSPKDAFSSPQHVSFAHTYASPAPKRTLRSSKHTSKRGSSSRKSGSSARKHVSSSRKHASSSRKHVSTSSNNQISSPRNVFSPPKHVSFAHTYASPAPKHTSHSSRHTSKHGSSSRKSGSSTRKHVSSSREHVSTSSKNQVSSPKNVFSSPKHVSFAHTYASPTPKHTSRSSRHTPKRGSSSRESGSSTRNHVSTSRKHRSSSKKRGSSSQKHVSLANKPVSKHVSSYNQGSPSHKPVRKPKKSSRKPKSSSRKPKSTSRQHKSTSPKHVTLSQKHSLPSPQHVTLSQTPESNEGLSPHHHLSSTRNHASHLRTHAHNHTSHTHKHRRPHPTTTGVAAQPTPTVALKLEANNNSLDAPVPLTIEGIQMLVASSFGSCPPPLIPNTRNIVSASCSGLCCLPCPATATFYEPGILDKLNEAIGTLRVISCMATLFLGISYLVLPDRKQGSHMVLMFMFFTNAVWQGMGTIWLSKRKEHTCHSDVEESTLANNALCGAQGILLVYLTGVLFCQALTLMANMFALIVYRSTRLQAHLLKLLVLSFVLPVSLVVYPWIQQSFGYVGYGSMCFMTSDLADAHFFYPIMALMTIGVSLHFATVGYVIKMYIQRDQDWSNAVSAGSAFSLSALSMRQKSVQTAREVTTLLHQQWRPAAFVLCQLVIFWVYFGFYFFETKKFEHIKSTLPWFQDWVECLGQQAVIQIGHMANTSSSPMMASSIATPSTVEMLGLAGQAQCQTVAAPHVPAFHKLVLSELGPPMFGIIVFFIFASKLALWQDWKKTIAQKVFRRSPDVDLQTFKIIEKPGVRSAASSAHGYGDDCKKNGFFGGEKSSSSSVLSLPPPVYESRPGARQGNMRFESPDAKNANAPAYDDGFIPYVAPPPGSKEEEEKKKSDVKRQLSLQQRLLGRSRSYAQEGLSISGGAPRSNNGFGLFSRDRLEPPALSSSSPLSENQNTPTATTTTAAAVSQTQVVPPPQYTALSAVPETPRLGPNRSFSTRSSRSSKSSLSPSRVDSSEVQRATRHQVVGASDMWPSNTSAPVATAVSPLVKPVRHAVGGSQDGVRRTASTSSVRSSSRQERRAALEGTEEEGAVGDGVTHYLVRLNSMSGSRSALPPRSSAATPPPGVLPPKSQRRSGGGVSPTPV
ncbi:hypothetical protein BGZ73_005140 [Actinomortierella ambigua]|nr:hypothetical protein BGZ73_005140 [Actinomortierella ambigua]